MKSKPSSGALPAFAAISIALAVVVGAMCAFPQEPKRGGVSPEGPAVVTPTTAPRQSLSLALDLPELDADQAYWLRKAQIVTTCPLCAAVDAPPIELDANARTAWLALIWTESRYSPWAVSEIGCYGLGQLCGDLKTQETDERPEWNLYVSAREFARLVATSADLNEAVASYKGSTSSDTKWQADTVWAYVRISGAN